MRTYRQLSGILAAALIIVSAAAARPAWGVAPWSYGITPSVTDMVNDPLRFYSFDPGVITWKMSQEFRNVFSDPYAQYQVRRAFDEWQIASSSALRRSDSFLNRYAWARFNGWQEFFDLQSIMIHEIGHALGSQHPDAAWFNGTPQYMRNYRPDGMGGWTPAPPPGGEVMNEGNFAKIITNNPNAKGLLEGEYWRTVSRDELDWLDFAYGAPIQFVEVGPNADAMITIGTFGTPGGPSGGTLGIAGPDTWENRVAGDASQGRRILTASIDISASAPIGVMAKSQTWEVTNRSGQAIEAISIRTRGTSTPNPVKVTSGGTHRFTDYEPHFTLAQFQWEDRSHRFLDPVGGSIPSGLSVQIGLQLDVWDWTVQSARARSVGGDIFDVTLAPPGIGTWFHFLGGDVVEPPDYEDSLANPSPLYGARLINVPAVGIVIQGVEDAETIITELAFGRVRDPFLGPDDLGPDLLAGLRDAGELHEFAFRSGPDGGIHLGPEEQFVFVLRGGADDLPDDLRTSGRFQLLNLPHLADDPLVVFVRTEESEFMIGSYALLNSGIIRVPEPGGLALAAIGFAASVLRRVRRQSVV